MTAHENAFLGVKELPRYRSHKEVHALKITAVKTGCNGNKLSFEGDYEDKLVEDTTSRPTPRVGWYMIVYSDGYISFSPAEQFEEGYTKIS